jgi:hypothetical protein
MGRGRLGARCYFTHRYRGDDPTSSLPRSWRWLVTRGGVSNLRLRSLVPPSSCSTGARRCLIGAFIFVQLGMLDRELVK